MEETDIQTYQKIAMKDKQEIIKLYIMDLKNLIEDSPARQSRIEWLEDQLTSAPTVTEMEICEYCGEQLPTNCPRCERLISNKKEE